MIIGDDEWEEEENLPAENLIEEFQQEQETGIQISLHTLNSNTSETTLRIKVAVGGMEILILIDTGSTHNFLNSKTVEYLHFVTQEDKPMQVCVADGYRMIYKERCKTFEWVAQGNKFSTNMRLIPLKGCDAVLGAVVKNIGRLYFQLQ